MHSRAKALCAGSHPSVYVQAADMALKRFPPARDSLLWSAVPDHHPSPLSSRHQRWRLGLGHARLSPRRGVRRYTRCFDSGTSRTTDTLWRVRLGGGIAPYWGGERVRRQSGESGVCASLPLAGIARLSRYRPVRYRYRERRLTIPRFLFPRSSIPYSAPSSNRPTSPRLALSSCTRPSRHRSTRTM